MAFSLAEKIGQMLVVGFHGTEPPAHILDWLSRGRVGGIILFARNIESPAQVARLTQACHDAAERPVLIAIDQEGGVVARLREGFTESPGAMAFGAADSEVLAEEMAFVLGTEMRALGINWNLAPAIDLTHNIHNPSVGVRSLGTDPERVKQLSVAQVRGFQKAGVAATAKHFPGKANTPVDPHVSLPVIEGALDDMWETDLVPFRAVSDAGIAAMMITHVQFKALEPEYPSSMSPRIIQGLLREKIGFDGVVSTDCMEMGAITNQYGPGESAVLAALAGASTILFSHTQDSQEAVYDALLAAAHTGRIPTAQIDAAVEKVLAMKARFAITGAPSLDHIRAPEHLETAAKAARAGIVALQGVPSLRGKQVALVEFASHLESEALEHSGQTGFAALLHERLPGLQSIGLHPASQNADLVNRAKQLVASCDVAVIATRSAHLVPQQRELAQILIDAAKQPVLLCLRNPYDAGALTGAAAVLCTCGDSAPSLAAAVEALMGDFTPAAKLPVPVWDA